jgi:hypothetical protein
MIRIGGRGDLAGKEGCEQKCAGDDSERLDHGVLWGDGNKSGGLWAMYQLPGNLSPPYERLCSQPLPAAKMG